MSKSAKQVTPSHVTMHAQSLCARRYYRLLQTYVCLTLDTMTEYDYVPFKAFLSFVDPALFSTLDPPLEL